jgi:nucleoside-diphosphate-sugar epimerase
MEIFLTGSSGFVGKNFISFFKKNNQFTLYKRGSKINIKEDIVIHFAGKAHDLKNISSSKEYYDVNTELTKNIFDCFLKSKAKVFIMLSSVKAIADSIDGVLTENHIPNPKTHYGKSKLLAEQYIFSKKIPGDKRIYILRPCMIHGPENKGNLNLLFKFVLKGIPWPLGSFQNQRSYCSIENLLFVIKELMKNKMVPSGVYNVADDKPLSTNKIISLIANSQNKTQSIWNVPVNFIKFLALLGDKIPLPLNSERLKKLTESYIVSNSKIVQLIDKPLPVKSEEGMLKTFESFN